MKVFFIDNKNNGKVKGFYQKDKEQIKENNHRKSNGISYSLAIIPVFWSSASWFNKNYEKYEGVILSANSWRLHAIP